MNYSKKTIPELKAICKERKIKGISGKRKQALIDLIKQSESEPKSPSTNKTEHTSKIKRCKQEGHNKRSCKTMTTPVLTPKNEAETDIKVEPQVKVEMASSGSTLTNVEFEVCEKLYNKNNDLNTLYNNPNGIKYLMIRSFAKDDLVEISKEKDKKNKHRNPSD